MVILAEILVDSLLENLVEFFAAFLLGHGGFVDEVGLAGEPSPIDRAGNRPYITDSNMPARFAHDPLQSAGDRCERLLVHAQSGS